MASFTPTIAGQMSGSIGAYTFSHNKGGPYVRLRSNPTQPNTIYQQYVKLLTGQFSTGWTTALSQAQRDAWGVYAANVPRPKPGGGTQYLTGLQHFIRSNVPRLQGGLNAVLDAPIVYNVGAFTNPNAAAGVPPNGFDVNFATNDDWVGETGAAMLIWTGRPKGQGIRFFKGPFRAIVGIKGDLAAPPTSPATLITAFAYGLGVRMWFKYAVCRADGRLSDFGIQEIVMP